jgi:hypothetical protein
VRYVWASDGILAVARIDDPRDIEMLNPGLQRTKRGLSRELTATLFAKRVWTYSRLSVCLWWVASDVRTAAETSRARNVEAEKSGVWGSSEC